MKKHLFLTSMLLLTIFIAHAQLPSFDLGIKAGANLASLKGDVASSENRLGYQAGVWARIGGLGFYVQPEAYLGSKGGKFEQEDQNFSGKVNFTTLDVPVLVGNKIGTNNFNIRFMAGPIFSFLLKEDVEKAATDFRGYRDQTIGAQLGAGVDLGNLAVDLRFEKGLSNISKSGQYDQKQNLWHFSLGYKLF
ncbi:porin family protein [Pedobacter sp. SYSU D00535]|uniref:porin family protein n=1 Tax=Pedobacter sp. SYSU D00535 TaxID=2810308 RepID=UPI001A9712BC|nr:porin family protein [Pedobacter sp. SYSU D00535]